MKYQKKFSFLNTEIRIKNNKLHTKIFRKKTDHQTFLNINSEHLKSLKNSIPYSQALRIKRICSTKKDFDHHSRELKERFLKQGYHQKLVNEQLEKVDKLVRDDLLKEKDQEQQDPKCISLILTYSPFLLNLTAVVHKNWNILQTNKNLWELFQEHPITAFKRNTNLKEIIGSTRISIPSRTGEDTPCLSGTKTLLQPSADNKHIHEPTNKMNIKKFL